MRSGKHIVALGVSVVLVAIGGNGRALAQGAEQQMPKSKILDVPAAVLRTMADIKNDQLKAAPLAPAGGIPFRPGMDAAAYEAEKAAALSRGASSGRSAAPVQAPGPLAVVAEMNCDGANQTGSGNWYPPDADSAVGLTQLVQVSNTNITIWDKTAVGSTGCPDPLTNPLFSSDLNSFFGYVGPGATTLFDPRVVHDDVYGRWIVAADAFPDSAGAQLQFIAASTTEDAIGPYLVVALNTRSLTCPTCFWDYPQLGLDEDSIMLTANIFNPGYVDSRWLFLNKARLYAGIGGAFGCFFFGFGTGTPSWAPPKAMDLNPITYMIEAPPSGAALSLIGLTGTDRICPIIQINQPVAVPGYSPPPDAPQPGTAQLLDTLDSRFQNRSLQIGGDLWQVHTVADGGFADVQWFRINLSTTPRSLAQSGNYFTSGPSFDFNPAITANGSGSAAMVYSSTNPTAGFQAEVRVTGKATADANFGPSGLAFRSTAPLTGNPQGGKQRWGDYSSINVDPLNASRAWGVNETVDPSDPLPGNSWGTRFFKATFP